ncbi:DUF4158 domain-containing protein [Streptomyces naphthomycinicus]|uniref:DUF4158 domain-containing protein n=1 Tax=Streptomyces naphthomycinicus TaxID=2872625 RepID=UPI001CED918F
MPVDFLSDDQVSRYGRFAAEPTPSELEQFFRVPGLEAARSKRAPANRLGFAVLWGSVRMLGVFPRWCRPWWCGSRPSSSASRRPSGPGTECGSS